MYPRRLEQNLTCFAPGVSGAVLLPVILKTQREKCLWYQVKKYDRAVKNARTSSCTVFFTKALHPPHRPNRDSSLLADGATPDVVQRQLRHSDPRITLGIYGHVVGNQQRDAVENRSARIAKYAVN